ncbi:hypothetical protein ABL78_4050 [Leptomonas seymouri]|uniref:Uncharacterized protein n=1 Tax=Leptomonas seymouri TaxID=5684 RepID=A0A0N1I5B0_LEPSE|nr:hypothetical protein ABL78_4050 [Leptomonas seymouri]|eukprot:KPI86860.1 hypothetical protein ABL78_4050 [Leptomonas seymouri]
MLRSPARRLATGPFALSRLLLSDEKRYKELSDILNRARTPSPSQGTTPEFFNGHFQPGSGYMDPHSIAQMQNTLRASMTPELRDSMASMLQSALQSGDGMPGGSMGMMAFGVGENERGKKVARAAKLSYDLKTGKVNKDFMEEQLEPDDVSLPKETVGDYNTDGATEVEFVEDQKQVKSSEPAVESIAEAEIEVETTETKPL